MLNRALQQDLRQHTERLKTWFDCYEAQTLFMYNTVNKFGINYELRTVLLYAAVTHDNLLGEVQWFTTHTFIGISNVIGIH